MSRESWERRYAEGNHEHQSAPPDSPAELAGFLAGLAQLPQSALDLGCGTGADAVFLATQGIETVGLDFSAAALELARDRASGSGVRVEWVEADVLDLPLGDASVDLVTDRGCLHHVASSDQPRYAHEVARVLRPGGRLLIREMNEAGRHEHAITEEAIRAMIVDVPLEVASIVSFDANRANHPARTTITVLART